MKIIRTLNTVVISLLCLIFISCDDQVYAYHEGFSNYMDEEYQIDIANVKDNIYYILPLSDCSSCQSTSLNLALLSSTNLKSNLLTLIIVGQTNNSIYKDLIEGLPNSFTILKDANNTIYSYQTGLNKPMLLHIKNGRVEHYLKITDFKVEDAGKYITGNL